jgi:hypothetical protein
MLPGILVSVEIYEEIRTEHGFDIAGFIAKKRDKGGEIARHQLVIRLDYLLRVRLNAVPSTGQPPDLGLLGLLQRADGVRGRPKVKQLATAQGSPNVYLTL